MLNRSLAFCITVLAALPATSQITITSADMPNSGDSVRVSYAGDTLDPMLTGPNYIWNYTHLQATAQWLHQFDNPANFTFPFNLLFNPLNTSYGQAQYTPDSIPLLGLQPDNAYAFLRESSTKYRQVGAGLTINSLPIPFAYTPHDTIYRFPMNFGNTDSSYAEYGLNIPGIGYYGQSIARRNIVDGWGTLITPFGSFQTLRVLSLVHQRDTFADTSGVLGFAFDRPLKYEFKWLGAGGKIPYLFVTANDVAGLPVISNIEYRDSMRNVLQIGIAEHPEQEMAVNIYPNPSSGWVILEWNQAEPASVQIAVSDISGKMLFQLVRDRSPSGVCREIIELGRLKLSDGLYFLHIRSGHQSGVKKLLIQH